MKSKEHLISTGSQSSKKKMKPFEPTGLSPFSVLKNDLRYKTPKSGQARNVGLNQPKTYGAVKTDKFKSKAIKNNNLAEQAETPMLTDEQVLHTNESLSN